MCDWPAWQCDFLEESKKVSRCKWESPVQIAKHPPGLLWYSHARLCVFVCVFLCVLAEAVATSPLALWIQQQRLFLNVGPALCLLQAATGTAAHLSCQHSLCLPGIYLAVLFGCVHVCVRWIKRVMHFLFILGRRVANDTKKHTPPRYTQQRPDMYIDTNVTGWGSLWRSSYKYRWLWEMYEQLVCKDWGRLGRRRLWVLLTLGMWKVA